MDRAVDNYANEARLGHRLALIDRRNSAWIDVYCELRRVRSVIQSFAPPTMTRFLFKFVACVLLALAVGFAYLAVRSGDQSTRSMNG
jgi:hypothetical protein